MAIFIFVIALPFLYVVCNMLFLYFVCLRMCMHLLLLLQQFPHCLKKAYFILPYLNQLILKLFFFINHHNFPELEVRLPNAYYSQPTI